MAVDQLLQDRISNIFHSKNIPFYTKKMFGGVCFMVDEKMCCGTFKNGIMARVSPDEISELLEKEGAEQMMNGGRMMKGYLLLSEDAYDMDEDLEFWVQKCIDFNPQAKSSKKRR